MEKKIEAACKKLADTRAAWDAAYLAYEDAADFAPDAAQRAYLATITEGNAWAEAWAELKRLVEEKKKANGIWKNWKRSKENETPTQ